MKSFLFPLAVLVSSAMAQDQTQTTSACGADYIVESCLDTQKAALGVCTVTDYACHCNGWTNLMAYDASIPKTLSPYLLTRTHTQLLHQLPQRPQATYVHFQSHDAFHTPPPPLKRLTKY